MTNADFLALLFPSGDLTQLTPDQNAILRHKQGPGWVIAGPSCGKTATLALLALRLLYVEGDSAQAQRARPEQLLVTTFTEKAARDLVDRIRQYHALAMSRRPDLGAIDIRKIRVGTLHRLCNEILHECRAPNYRDVRLMDEFENSTFVYERISIVDAPNTAADKPFWKYFATQFSAGDSQLSGRRLPSKWTMTMTLVELFKRVAQDRVSIETIRAAGMAWNRLADLYQEYRAKLAAERRCSSSELHVRFLEFLEMPLGRRFRDGDPNTDVSGIKWVLADNYQDASPIQAEICLELANRLPKNIVTFGDEDEALYGSRGGSGECMVRFDHACNVHLRLPITHVARYSLVVNFRSAPLIVSFCNEYITAFASTAMPGARVPDKRPLVAHRANACNYPAVSQLRAGTMVDLAHRFAEAVSNLRADGYVEDYNECCLLLKSTKETSKSVVKKYVQALRAKGIPAYNPDNGAILEQEEVRGLLGVLIAVTDCDARHAPPRPSELADVVTACRSVYAQLAAAHPRLSQFVTNTAATIAGNSRAFLKANLSELVYYILSLPPFSVWVGDPARRARLARITSFVERFSSMPALESPTSSSDRYVASPISFGGPSHWTRTFYLSFLGYLSYVDINEEADDDDVIAPPGMLPIMTIAQARSLQFQFVFVGQMGEAPSISIAHQLETQLAVFRTTAEPSFTRLPENVRAEVGLIRQQYVAYSRAQRGLVLMGTDEQFSRGRVPCGPNSSWLQNRVLRL